MNCEKAEFLLALYVSGDLDDAERELVNSHVSECPACLEKLNLFRSDRERVAALRAESGEIEAGGDFMDGVLEKIAEEDARKPAFFTAWHALAAAAAVILVACLVIFFGLSGSDDGRDGAFPPAAPPSNIDGALIRPVEAQERSIEIILPNRFERVRQPDEKRERTVEF
jgi:anti-sigma factor RsiW